MRRRHNGYHDSHVPLLAEDLEDEQIEAAIFYTPPPLDVGACFTLLSIGDMRFFQAGPLPTVVSLGYDQATIDAVLAGPNPAKGLRSMIRAMKNQRASLASTAATTIVDNATGGTFSMSDPYIKAIWEDGFWNNKNVVGYAEAGMTPWYTLSYYPKNLHSKFFDDLKSDSGELVVPAGYQDIYETDIGGDQTAEFGKQAIANVIQAAIDVGVSPTGSQTLEEWDAMKTFLGISGSLTTESSISPTEADLIEFMTTLIRDYIFSDAYTVPKYIKDIDWLTLSQTGNTLNIAFKEEAYIGDVINCLWLYKENYIALDNNIRQAEAAIDALQYSDHLLRLNEIAQEKGFASWAQMSAYQDVEIEWYCSIYGMSGCGAGETFPSQYMIEAYKRLEREQYGKTSLEMERDGEVPEFIKISDNPVAREILERLYDRKQQEAELALIRAEEELEAKKKEEERKQEALPQKVLIGGLLVIGALAFLDRRRG